MGFFFTIVTLVIALGLTWRYLGSYMAAVFDNRVHFLGWAERPVYRALGTSPEQEQTWKRYAGSLIIFSAVSFGITYLILRIQGSLPLNPQHLDAVPPGLSCNTAASFLTNTNWQNYGGETTMSYFSQVGALTVQQFVSPAVGIAVAIAMVRGFQRRHSPTIGNFWVDVTRCILYILLPAAFLFGIIFVAQGAVETFAGPVCIHDAMNGVTQMHRPGTDRVHGGDQAARHEWRRVLQCKLVDDLREPDSAHELAVDLPSAVDTVRADVHVRQDGRQHPSRCGPARRHGAHLRTVGRVHELRRAHEQPCGGRSRRPLDASGTQKESKRRFGDTTTALFGVASTNTSTGSADACLRLVHPDRRVRAPDRDDAR